VKASALYPSKLPFEFSTFRTQYCDPWAQAAREKKWFVCLKAEQVRKLLPKAWVVAAKPPPAHAEVLLPGAFALRPFETKAALQQPVHAKAWSDYSAMIEALAEIASDPEKVLPSRT
jgi:hypothetical protein